MSLGMPLWKENTGLYRRWNGRIRHAKQGHIPPRPDGARRQCRLRQRDQRRRIPPHQPRRCPTKHRALQRCRAPARIPRGNAPGLAPKPEQGTTALQRHRAQQRRGRGSMEQRRHGAVQRRLRLHDRGRRRHGPSPEGRRKQQSLQGIGARGFGRVCRRGIRSERLRRAAHLDRVPGRGSYDGVSHRRSDSSCKVSRDFLRRRVSFDPVAVQHGQQLRSELGLPELRGRLRRRGLQGV
mmetsp:Transcript_13118/g.31906  ORF Transcript_13118/g.31906 Transcript_13118/m.31906 type:complete len:238 (+) Transcript_13118:928-1641(+)